MKQVPFTTLPPGEIPETIRPGRKKGSKYLAAIRAVTPSQSVMLAAKPKTILTVYMGVKHAIEKQADYAKVVKVIQRQGNVYLVYRDSRETE